MALHIEITTEMFIIFTCNVTVQPDSSFLMGTYLLFSLGDKFFLSVGVYEPNRSVLFTDLVIWRGKEVFEGLQDCFSSYDPRLSITVLDEEAHGVSCQLRHVQLAFFFIAVPWTTKNKRCWNIHEKPTGKDRSCCTLTRREAVLYTPLQPSNGTSKKSAPIYPHCIPEGSTNSFIL